MTRDLVLPDGTFDPTALDWIAYNLQSTALALSGIIDQPRRENNLISVGYIYAAEKICDVQQIISMWASDIESIQMALEEVNKMYVFIKTRNLYDEFLGFQLSKHKNK